MMASFGMNNDFPSVSMPWSIGDIAQFPENKLRPLHKVFLKSENKIIWSILAESICNVIPNGTVFLIHRMDGIFYQRNEPQGNITSTLFHRKLNKYIWVLYQFLRRWTKCQYHLKVLFLWMLKRVAACVRMIESCIWYDDQSDQC